MINGIYAASLSLLNENLTLDCKKTISHAEDIIDNGCHGVVFFGSESTKYPQIKKQTFHERSTDVPQLRVHQATRIPGNPWKQAQQRLEGPSARQEG